MTEDNMITRFSGLGATFHTQEALKYRLDPMEIIEEIKAQLRGWFIDNEGKKKYLDGEKGSTITEEAIKIITSTLRTYLNKVVFLGYVTDEMARNISADLGDNLNREFTLNYTEFGFRTVEECERIIVSISNQIYFAITHAVDGREADNLTKMTQVNQTDHRVIEDKEKKPLFNFGGDR